jgi:hypothetical protein
MASSYPNAIDGPATLYTPVDAFSTRPLETTATQQILAGDTTISVVSTDGFAASYGILSIDDELIVYTSKTATQFTGCQRGAFGTTAAQHAQGVAVKANMASAFITALQSAVTAIENELGTVAARNYVRRDGAVTITGVKTFVDGAEFGAGTKSSTGLVRLPNAGAVKWRKADNSGDLGMALNANDHLAFDTIIDFAPGQTFGALTVPDATTTSKGVVQIDPVGGIAVNAGVISLANSGATPGTYPKVTVDAKGRVTVGAPLAGSDLPAHQHVASDIVSGAFGVARGGTGLTTIAANKLLYSPSQDTLAELSVGTGLSLAAGVLSLGSHSHAESDVAGLVTDLAARPLKGPGFAPSRAAIINSSGAIDAAVGNGGDCVLVDGTSVAKADASHTHPASDIVSSALALARGGTGADLSASGPGFLRQASAGAAVTVAALQESDLPAHSHTSAQISDATPNATASTVVLRDTSGGASFAYVAANNLWAYLDSHLQSVECGAYGTVGGPFENMAKYSEDFSVATWDKNGGSCSVTANAATAPDGNMTAGEIDAVTATPIIQQQIAGLVSGGQYTFYIWARVASGTRKVSIAIVDNPYASYLAGPTQITLTTAWQRFKMTGTLAAGQTGLWIVVRQYAANGDDWTSGSILLWGACLQQGNDPKKGYARTWGYQAAPVAAGVACGPLLVVAKDDAESPFRVAGPGSNLADDTLLQVTSAGELVIAGGSGNGYRFAELMGASNPSGWSGVIKVKNPAGVTAGYILLYSNP